MAKCPVCNCTFEPTPEEIKHAAPFSVNLCSCSCWVHAHPKEAKNYRDHRWEYHEGERTPLPPVGKQTGIVDHSKYKLKPKNPPLAMKRSSWPTPLKYKGKSPCSKHSPIPLV